MSYINDALNILSSKCNLKFKNKQNVISFDCKINNQIKSMKFYVRSECLERSVLDDHYMNHFYRLFHNNDLAKLTDDNIYEFIEFVDCKNDVFSQCTICGNDIINTSDKLRSCDDEECQKTFEETVTDNDIIDSYKFDNLAFNIVLLSSFACLAHPHKDSLFTPIPKSFKTLKSIQLLMTNNYKSFATLISTIESSADDFVLYEKIGKADYAFIKFSIISNTTKMMSHVFLKKQTNIFENKEIKNILNTDEIISFDVQHTMQAEKKAYGKNPSFLFHGSSLSNWHSIFRSGLKNMSGTKLMAHGALCGSGIYLSDDANISFAYGADKYCSTNLHIIGVIQILDDKSKYLKGHYVVDNEDILILRHVIVVNVKKHTDLKFITDYFTTEREINIARSKLNMTFVKSKRMINEISSIKKHLKKYECEYD